MMNTFDTIDMLAVIEVLTIVSVLYFFIVNSVYLFLLIAAVIDLRKHRKIRAFSDRIGMGQSAFAPSISLLAPAYNEQKTVVESVRSFLMLNYPSFEVIVINDGSRDQTLNRLKENYDLELIPMIYDSSLSTTRVRGIYRSRLHPNLTVVDKENGGKADALNVGIGFAKNDIFCAVDSDSILENDALLKVAAPFLENPKKVIAAGGTVRIANGATVQFGRVEDIRLPRSPILLMQVIEYTRAFLCGRIGWNVLNSTLVISGAFGLFSKSAVKEIGGYTQGSIGEDMELVIRLHRHFRLKKRPYSIVFIPDPVCWTEAPATLSALGRQRDRWQRGLADTLMRNRGMIFNPRYGAVGLFAFPYFLFVELLGPLFEVISLAVVLTSFVYGEFDWRLMLAFFSASVLYGAVLSMASLIIEEVYFAKYSKVRQFVALFAVCLLESLWFRQLSTVWRLHGLYKYVRGDHTWGYLQRTGFSPKKAS